jgi:hypothetical protein
VQCGAGAYFNCWYMRQEQVCDGQQISSTFFSRSTLTIDQLIRILLLLFTCWQMRQEQDGQMLARKVLLLPYLRNLIFLLLLLVLFLAYVCNLLQIISTSTLSSCISTTWHILVRALQT